VSPSQLQDVVGKPKEDHATHTEERCTEELDNLRTEGGLDKVMIAMERRYTQCCGVCV
jgi:hypothetical protein